MSYYQLALDDLATHYTIIGCINLSDHDQPNAKTLVSALANYRNPVFNDTDRLVFIVDRTLTSTFDDYPPDILIELQQHIQYYNIPHFFVIILSNIDNLREYTVYLQQKYYRQETIPIPHINV